MGKSIRILVKGTIDDARKEFFVRGIEGAEYLTEKLDRTFWNVPESERVKLITWNCDPALSRMGDLGYPPGCLLFHT